jgi:hypothetical protein
MELSTLLSSRTLRTHGRSINKLEEFPMKNISKTIAMGALIITLSACGHSEGDRLASGAGLGAGAGAVAGGLTNSHQLDLGRPLWR